MRLDLSRLEPLAMVAGGERDCSSISSEQYRYMYWGAQVSLKIKNPKWWYTPSPSFANAGRAYNFDYTSQNDLAIPSREYAR